MRRQIGVLPCGDVSVNSRRVLRTPVALLLCTALAACQADSVSCAETGEGLRLEVVDRTTRVDLTARSSVTVTDLRDGAVLTGVGNDALRIVRAGGGQWTIRVELAGYRSRLDTVTTTRVDGCTPTPPVYRMELEPQR